MIDATIYTDGSCFPNPGTDGGWACVILLPHNVVFVFGRAAVELGIVQRNGKPSTTNNRMELLGVLMGLRVLPDQLRVVVISDSLYAINTITGRVNSNVNLDLIAACRAEVARMGKVVFRHVRGHRGDPYNEMADQLAGVGAAVLPPEDTWNGLRAHAIIYTRDQSIQGDGLTVAWYDQEVRLVLT